MRKSIGLIFTLVCLTGCTPLTYRTNASFDTYFKAKKKVAVLMPDMKIFKLTAGGVDQYQDDWSANSAFHMEQELRKELATFDSIDFVFLDPTALSDAQRQFVDRERSIFYTVAYSVVTHTYEPEMLFKHKVKAFDYTLGEELSEFNTVENVDAILFVNGRNYIWTAGRASLAFLSVAVSAFTGVYIPVPAGKEWLTASLVDVNSGDVLWFNYLPLPGDMRMEKTVRRLSKRLFRDFPSEWRDKKLWEKRKEEGNE